MQTKLTVRNMAIISAFALGVFLIIYYWSSIASGIGVVLGAFGPLVIGAVIAYLINILMRFYERHYFVKHCVRFGNATRRPVCLIGAILTILGVFGLVIGLVIPHLGRLLVGSDNTKMLPCAMLMGGLFLLLIDTVARTATALEIPLSILTGVIGAPIYAWLLWKQKAKVT